MMDKRRNYGRCWKILRGELKSKQNIPNLKDPVKECYRINYSLEHLH